MIHSSPSSPSTTSTPSSSSSSSFSSSSSSSCLGEKILGGGICDLRDLWGDLPGLLPGLPPGLLPGLLPGPPGSILGAAFLPLQLLWICPAAFLPSTFLTCLSSPAATTAYTFPTTAPLKGLVSTTQPSWQTAGTERSADPGAVRNVAMGDSGTLARPTRCVSCAIST
jgi:hypothetical protein